jgi:hypothetical protein
MSTQPMTSDGGRTQMEVVKTNSQTGRKLPLLAAVAILILIELGGMLLLCYRCENPVPVPMLQDR